MANLNYFRWDQSKSICLIKVKLPVFCDFWIILQRKIIFGVKGITKIEDFKDPRWGEFFDGEMKYNIKKIFQYFTNEVITVSIIYLQRVKQLLNVVAFGFSCLQGQKRSPWDQSIQSSSNLEHLHGHWDKLKHF